MTDHWATGRLLRSGTRHALAISAVAFVATTGCGGDDGSEVPAAAPAEEAAATDDELTCVQLGGGWTFTYNRHGSTVLPPGDGPPGIEPGKVSGGTEANLPADVLEASRVERVANGWTDADLAYLDAATDTGDPLRAARFAARMNGDPDDVREADLMANVAKARRQLADAPACP